MTSNIQNASASEIAESIMHNKPQQGVGTEPKKGGSVEKGANAGAANAGAANAGAANAAPATEKSLEERIQGELDELVEKGIITVKDGKYSINPAVNPGELIVAAEHLTQVGEEEAKKQIDAEEAALTPEQQEKYKKYDEEWKKYLTRVGSQIFQNQIK